MKKIYFLISLSLLTLFANATVHTIFVFCTGINPTTTPAVCGDSIRWSWGGCSDSSRSTGIPACATPWSFPINSTTPVYTIVPCAGTYNFTCYCNTSYFTGTIVVSCTLTASMTHTNLLCNGICTGSASVTASGGTPGYTYSWSPSGGTGATASSLCAGTYVCTITDANLGTTTASVTITQPPVLTGTQWQTDCLCFGDCTGTASVAASGGTPGYTYSWTPSGGNTSTSTGLCAGGYTCTITDANGCTITKTFLITQPTAISLIMTSTPASCSTCCDGTATVIPSGGTPAYTFMWTPPVSFIYLASNLCPGTYSCCVTDMNGCVSCDTTTVSFLTGFTHQSPFGNLSIIPNPSSNFITIEESFENASSSEISLLNVLGQSVYTKHLESAFKLNETIDLRALPRGIYFLSVTTNSGTEVRRIIKQ